MLKAIITIVTTGLLIGAAGCEGEGSGGGSSPGSGAGEETGEDEIITLINHGGTRAGSMAILMIVPDHNIVVAMTANTVGRGGSGPLASVAAKVARQFIYGRTPHSPSTSLAARP